MDASLKDRVQSRLDALKMPHWEVARMSGFNRAFLRDLLLGRKKSIRGSNLNALAMVLKCHPDYLTLQRSDPGDFPDSFIDLSSQNPEHVERFHLGSGLPLVGTAERGTFRVRRTGPFVRVPIGVDPRYMSCKQFAYTVNDDSLIELRICPGDVLKCIDATQFENNHGPIPDGSIIVCENEDNKLVETFVSELKTENGQRYAVSRSAKHRERIKIADPVRIVAIVKRIVRILP